MILTTVVQGGVAFHFFYRMEVMLMKKYDFKDLMAFGVFILALLTFIFQFNNNPDIRKPPRNLPVAGWLSIHKNY